MSDSQAMRIGTLNVKRSISRPYVLLYRRQKRRFPRIKGCAQAEAKARTDALFS